MTDKIWANRPWVRYVDDERDIGNSVIVTLADGYYFKCEPGCGVRGYDTLTAAKQETRGRDVYFRKESL